MASTLKCQSSSWIKIQGSQFFVIYSESSKCVWVLSFHLRCVTSVRLSSVKEDYENGSLETIHGQNMSDSSKWDKRPFLKRGDIMVDINMLKYKASRSFLNQCFFKTNHAWMASAWIMRDEGIAMVHCMWANIIQWKL